METKKINKGKEDDKTEDIKIKTDEASYMSTKNNTRGNKTKHTRMIIHITDSQSQE